MNRLCLALLLCSSLVCATPSKNEVLQLIQQHNIGYIRCFFSDLLNNLKEVVLPPSHLESALHDGLYFDGSSIPGFTHIYDSDMHLSLDTSTFRVVKQHNEQVGIIMCDVEYVPGKLYDGSARHALRQAIQMAADMGYGLYVGPEIEFFLFKDNKPLDKAHYFDTAQSTNHAKEILDVLHAHGVQAEKVHHEVAPGQYEFSIRYSDPLTIADQITLAKMALRNWANSNNLEAVFMPKPLAGQNGSGMHIHFSLYDLKTGNNLFYSIEDSNNLSDLAHHFIAGVLQHARELSILFNSTINSFKRLVPRYEAPIYICWAPKNRSALVRVPDFNNNRAARAELRCPDALCNPYLAFAGLLHAGLEGIQTRASIPQPVKKNLYKLSSTEIRDYGIQTLPSSLQEALTTFSDSLWIAEVFNPRLLTELKVLKRKEIDQYNHSISTWEWQQYKNC